MAYSWPSSKAATTTTDADSDSIKGARGDINLAISNQNKIIDMFNLNITEPANGKILVYNATDDRFDIGDDIDTGSTQNLWHTIDSDSGSTTPNSTTDTLTVSGGTGITTAVSGDTLTITNSAPEVNQNLWATVSSDSGSVAANSTTDTLTIAGGTGIATAVSGDTLTITGSATTYQFLTVAVDGQSDVVAESATDTLTLVAGTNITLTTDASADSVTITGAASTIGTHDIWIPAQAMYPTTTNGAVAATTTEITATRPEIRSLDFDQGSRDYAQFNIAMPKSWNEGTVTAEFYWVPAGSGGVSDGVTWGIQGVALSNDNPHDVVFGTAVTIDDLYIAEEDLHISPTSSAITIAGTPAAGDLVYFQIYRDTADGNDDLNRDAKLIGIKLHYTSEAGTDA